MNESKMCQFRPTGATATIKVDNELLYIINMYSGFEGWMSSSIHSFVKQRA